MVVAFSADGPPRRAVDHLAFAVRLVLDGCAADGRAGHAAGGVLLHYFGFLLVEVLAWVGGLVFEAFDEAVEAGGEEGAEAGADPVDPVVAWEVVQDDAGAEGAGGI